jgi:outer membrane PBP1 activator LpoA protein
MRLGSQEYSSSLGTYKKLSAVLTTARLRAAHPNAAVPPSVRQACLRLTRKPQIKREAVNSKESVALQTFFTAEATRLTLLLPCIGKSCMTAATIANGPMEFIRF